ncbi:MAG: ASCH domain-containing protein [Clostridia bacterium]|nr:ASCH domain-containing protein [Clostridia bacterium]
MKGLIIKKEWLNKILTGEKTWEIRGRNCRIRGKIELIQSGSGLVVGCCDLVDSFEIDTEILKKEKKKHCIEDINVIHYKKAYAWVIGNPVRYSTPRPYKHPRGAVIWVNL